MYKTHKQTEDIIYASSFKKNKRMKVYMIIVLGIIAFVLGFSRYNASQAMNYKAKALAQQRQAMLNSQIATERQIAYFRNIRTLVNNYK